MAERQQFVLPPITDPSVLAEIDRLAQRYVAARGLGMEILDRVGDGGEQLMKMVPAFLRTRLDKAVAAALRRTFAAASASRRVMGNRGDWFNRLGTTAAGALGGAAGIAGTMIELPVTVTILQRAILEIADEHGLDTDSDEIRAEALRIFATGGPLEEDDSTDTALLASRVLATAGAPAVPVLGAAAGASINYIFARYYQELARVQFGLMRLANETGIPREALAERLAMRIKTLEAKKLEGKRSA